jgi:uncharacterized protein YcbX
VSVGVWEWVGVAGDEGDAAAAWFSELLGKRVRLVRWLGDGSLPRAAIESARGGAWAAAAPPPPPPRSAKEKALVGALAAFAAFAALTRVPDSKVNLLAGFLASSGANECIRRRRQTERWRRDAAAAPPTRRTDPAFAPDAASAFSDGFPMLIVSEGSLRALNDGLKAKNEPAVPMNRFRPNVVFDGVDAFDEDAYADVVVRGGSGKGVTLQFVKPCARCVMPSVDQDAGARGGLDASPLPTLGEMRSGRKLGFRAKWADEKYFGWNVVTDDVGEVISVGDAIELGARRRFDA